MKRLFSLLFLFVSSVCVAQEPLANFEEDLSDFVLETIRVEIPDYPNAFNPSILRWHDRYLLSFRVIPERRASFNCRIGLIWLDEQFQPTGEAQLLDTRAHFPGIPSRSEDARLITVGEHLYMIYSDNTEAKISKGGFRVYVAKLTYNGTSFEVEQPECLASYEGATRERREKNWVPFDYQGRLYLAYSLNPHLIFHPLQGMGACETICTSTGEIEWNWGALKGGTPALLDQGEYLAFFHTWKKMASVHSEGAPSAHYFMGAYRFQAEPPFALTAISPKPIVAKGFYTGEQHKPYWGPVQAIFPCGYVADERFIWVAYGRQDHECWIAKLDKQGLLNSLVPVSPSP